MMVIEMRHAERMLSIIVNSCIFEVQMSVLVGEDDELVSCFRFGDFIAVSWRRSSKGSLNLLLRADCTNAG